MIHLLSVTVPVLFLLLIIMFVAWNKHLVPRFSGEDWALRVGLLWIITTTAAMLFLWTLGVPRTVTFLYCFYSFFGMGAIITIVGLAILLWKYRINQYYGAEVFNVKKRGPDGV